MSLKDIAEAMGAALAFCYVAYNELRIKKLEQADEQLKRRLSDVEIAGAVHLESDDQLKLDLDNGLSATDGKSKA